MSNLISTEINPQSIKEIVDLIKDIKNKMPYLINIDSSSQLLLPKLKEEHLQFVEKCLDHAKNVPAIVPNYIEISEFEKALKFFNELQVVYNDLTNLTELVKSTITVSGSDAYVAAISIFNSVRRQTNNDTISEIHSIHLDLSKAFENLGDSKPTHI